MQPACGRRRCLALVAGLLVSAGVAQPAWARPGFPAKYAYARPMYLRGRLVSREDTLPYVRLTVDVPRDGTQPPQHREWMRPLEDTEASPTLTALVPLDRTGRLTLTLDWRLSRALLDDTSLLAVGDEFEAVVYQRTSQDEYRGELLAVLLRGAGDEVLVNSRPAAGRRPVPVPAAIPSAGSVSATAPAPAGKKTVGKARAAKGPAGKTPTDKGPAGKRTVRRNTSGRRAASGTKP